MLEFWSLFAQLGILHLLVTSGEGILVATRGSSRQGPGSTEKKNPEQYQEEYQEQYQEEYQEQYSGARSSSSNREQISYLCLMAP